jgi:hypothetical protein
MTHFVTSATAREYTRLLRYCLFLLIGVLSLGRVE